MHSERPAAAEWAASRSHQEPSSCVIKGRRGPAASAWHPRAEEPIPSSRCAALRALLVQPFRGTAFSYLGAACQISAQPFISAQSFRYQRSLSRNSSQPFISRRSVGRSAAFQRRQPSDLSAHSFIYQRSEAVHISAHSTAVQTRQPLISRRSLFTSQRGIGRAVDGQRRPRGKKISIEGDVRVSTCMRYRALSFLSYTAHCILNIVSISPDSPPP